MKAPSVLLTSLLAALLAIVLLLPTAQSQDSRTVKLGFLLEDVDPLLPKVINKAFYLLNRERSYGAKPRLEYKIETVNAKDSFTASKKVCEMLEKFNAAAILGPETLSVSFQLDSMSSTLFIPYIKILPDFYSPPLNDEDGRNIPHRQSVNVVPQPQNIGKAIANYIEDRKWYREFIFIYEDVEALFRVQKALMLKEVTVQSMQLDPEGDYRPQLKAIKDRDVDKIMLDCSLEKVTEFFKQAESVGMVTEFYDYLIVNLDMYALDFRRFSSRAVNITGFRLVKNDLPEFKDFEAQVRSLYTLEEISAMPFGIKTGYAYIYDALLLAINTIDKLFENKYYNAIYRPSISCRNHSKLYSQEFVRTLHEMEIDGLTGKISFDEHGVRTDYNLTLLKMQKDSNLHALAEWNDHLGIHNIFSEEQLQEQTAAQLSNQKIRITTIQNTPFFSIKKDADLFEGNDKYYGFSVDLVKAMAEKGNFIPVIKPVADGKYGDNKTGGVWNGMVGALTKQDAEAAVADLTITRARQAAVDFTTPFMNLGISILFKKTGKTPPSLFSFLLPFDSSVWICMGTAYLGVSIVLFVLARISPSEWDNPHPCDSEPEELENQFNLINCMWFAMGSLLQQGCDFLPK